MSTSDDIVVAKVKGFFYFGGKNADSTPVLIGRRRRRRLEYELLKVPNVWGEEVEIHYRITCPGKKVSVEC